MGRLHMAPKNPLSPPQCRRKFNAPVQDYELDSSSKHPDFKCNVCAGVSIKIGDTKVSAQVGSTIWIWLTHPVPLCLEAPCDDEDLGFCIDPGAPRFTIPGLQHGQLHIDCFGQYKFGLEKKTMQFGELDLDHILDI